MDCVVGYHLDPLTCGIAKFNATLGQKLGVPVLGVFDPAVQSFRAPLLSIKLSEFSAEKMVDLEDWLDRLDARQSLTLFLHDYGAAELEDKLLGRADHVICGNRELVERMKAVRPDAIEAWCPGTLLDARPFARPEISVFSFGMAHKIRADHYGRLDALLRQTGKSYRLFLSTALHEGTTFEGVFSETYRQMRDTFGGEIYFLGFLSDAAVYNYLVEATYFAAFFDTGARANNTSLNVAMQCGAAVITNLDDYSPPAFVHKHNMLDIDRCRSLPTDPEILAKLGSRAMEAAKGLGWDALLEKLSATIPRETV